MAFTPPLRSFEVEQILIRISGAQPNGIDAHISTTTTKRKSLTQDVLTVTWGSLLVYCYDYEVVRAYAGAWATAAHYAPAVLPESVTGAVEHTQDTSLILRVVGAPQRQQVHGIAAGASRSGVPYVRVHLDRLVVEAYDQASVLDTAECWERAEAYARRLWPQHDQDLIDFRAMRRARKGHLNADLAAFRALQHTPAQGPDASAE